MLVDRALRTLISVGTGAVTGLLRGGPQHLSDTLSGAPQRQPAQPRTTVANVASGEAPAEVQQHALAFGLDGQTYEIDLDAKHAGELRSTLQRYIDAGPRIGEQPPDRRAAPAPATTGSARPRPSASTTQRNDTSAIRAWARPHGRPVSDRGRIPAAVRQAYESAQHGSSRPG